MAHLQEKGSMGFENVATSGKQPRHSDGGWVDELIKRGKHL
jgi:hypothetical protein